MFKKIFILFILFYIIFYTWKKHLKERNYPLTFNNKLRVKMGQNKFYQNKPYYYSKNIFWGKPIINDNIKKSLDKIEWLGTNYDYEITWRRSLYYSIILSLIIFIVTGQYKFQIEKLLLIIFIIYIGFFIYNSRYRAGYLKIKSYFISQNIKNIKNSLQLKLDNYIYKFFHSL
jgi:hypothetical protein